MSSRKTQPLLAELGLFLRAWFTFFQKRFLTIFERADQAKSWGASFLYRRRGKMVRPFSHFSVGLLVLLVIAVSPLISFKDEEESYSGQVLGVSKASYSSLALDSAGSQPMGGVVDYTVREGDTVSSIAQKFGVSLDTIRWANDLSSINDIQEGETLKILPVSGILHTVRRGETVYSIADTYDVSPQAIVDFPFNTFINDETFALAVGQELIVPGGVKPKVKQWSEPQQEPQPIVPQQPAPGAEYVWPAVGRISQGYYWYHKAIDLANSSASSVVASRGGTVITAGWVAPRAYGIHVIIDHGDGYQTLYAHLSSAAVSPGQQVLRGQVIGQMGSTGRSTGVHLHFEVRTPAGNANPLNYLK